MTTEHGTTASPRGATSGLGSGGAISPGAASPARRGRRAVPQPLRVIVLTPGVGGMGGISRLMDFVAEDLAEEPRPALAVTFVSTRRDVFKALRPLVFAFALLRVAYACASGRCALLHINLASYGSTYRKLSFAAIARATGTPYVVHLHGGMYKEFWDTRSPRMKQRIDALFRQAEHVLVLGAVWRDLVAANLPDVAGRITVLPNATREPATIRLRSHSEPFTILFIGRLNEAKGVTHLVEALASLRHVGGWRAILAGDGEVSRTRAAVQNAGLEDRVEVPGWLEAGEVAALWRKGDAFVLPSFVENLPLSIIEAFAYGVPVICTPVGSIPELVEDGRTGLIVPAGDSAALARALDRLMASQLLCRALAENGRREFLERFELRGYVDRLAALWKNASDPALERVQVR